MGLPPIKRPSPFPWMELSAHIGEEYGLRGHGLPAGFVWDVALPRPTNSGVSKGAKEFTERGLNPEGKLIKYGNQAWLRETFLTGRWQISPASSYSSHKLCRARRDSELFLDFKVPFFKPHPSATDVLDETFADILLGVKSDCVKAPTDYYLVCFARTFVHRLFDDFDSDSCLVVTDEKLFTAKMMNAFAAFRPRWRGICKRVEYVDPVMPQGRPDIFFAKHFRYAYQDEFRFVWTPEPAIAELDVAFLELGPLADCCEFLPLTLSQVA